MGGADRAQDVPRQQQHARHTHRSTADWTQLAVKPDTGCADTVESLVARLQSSGSMDQLRSLLEVCCKVFEHEAATRQDFLDRGGVALLARVASVGIPVGTRVLLMRTVRYVCRGDVGETQRLARDQGAIALVCSTLAMSLDHGELEAEAWFALQNALNALFDREDKTAISCLPILASRFPALRLTIPPWAGTWCGAIRNVCELDKCRVSATAVSAVVEAGFLPVLLSVANRALDTSCIGQALCAVWNVSAEMPDATFEGGATEVVRSLLPMHVCHEGITQACCAILLNMFCSVSAALAIKSKFSDVRRLVEHAAAVSPKAGADKARQLLRKYDEI
eukprot:TRINITY_DN14654_c0_g1_i1.p1 TRINITY_DN14654_c0_g1~~TRINITY_DN14654_c0_g1_i1.p1  ORF type:complete len:389 (-),score=31.62 TRINITY_DN14654_c0_g1_i1:411-1418(-)